MASNSELYILVKLLLALYDAGQTDKIKEILQDTLERLEGK